MLVSAIKRSFVVFITVFITITGVGDLQAQVLMTSARQMAEGSLKLLMYYGGVAGQDVDFTLNGPGTASTSLSP